jgi:hypothetical protein
MSLWLLVKYYQRQIILLIKQKGRLEINVPFAVYYREDFKSFLY